MRTALNNDPATSGVQDQLVELENASGVRTAEFGFSTDTVLDIFNRVHDGHVRFRAENNAGTARTLLELDPAGNSQLYDGGANVVVLDTNAQGITIGAGVTGANTVLDVTADTGQDAVIRQANDIGGLRNDVLDTTGLARWAQADSAGVFEESWIEGTRNGQLEMFHNGTGMARTATAGNGGLEVNNTVTGAGYERVLTTSDAGGPAAETGVSSGPGTYVCTADLTRTNNTLQDDSDMDTGTTLDGSAYYELYMTARFSCASATPDLQIAVNGNTWLGAMHFMFQDEHSTAFGENVLGDVGVGNAGTTVALDGVNDVIVTIIGHFRFASGGASSRAMAIQWAQNTTDGANGVTRHQGSFLTVRKIQDI